MKALDKMGGFKAMASEKPEEMSESADAASDILQAIAAKDAKALDAALQRHYVSCEGEEKAPESSPKGLLDEDD